MSARTSSRKRDIEDLIGNGNVVSFPSVNPLDRTITVTRFDKLSGSRKTELNLSLRDISRIITDTVANSREALPLVKLATFGDERTARDSLRHDANLIGIDGVEVDYDRGHLSPLLAVRRLEKAGIAALVYTTPSHELENPRWRVFAPCSRTLAPSDRAALVARLNGLFDGTLDTASYTASQSFFIGRVRGGDAVKTYLVDGRYIDRADDLDAGAIWPKGYDGERQNRDREPSPPLGITLPQASRMLDGIRDWADERETWVRVGMALHHEFDGWEAAWRLFDEWSREGKGYDRRGNRAQWNGFDSDRAGVITMATVNAELLRRGSDAALVDDLRDLFEDLPDEDQPRKGCLTFRSLDQCSNAPAREYVVKGLLARGDVGCIFGAPGAGKSLIAPYLAYMLAQGRTAFNMRTRQGTTFYVACEDEIGMDRRCDALRQVHGDASNFILVGGCSDLLSPDSRHLKELQRAIAERKPSLIVIDTLAMAFPGLEENSAEGMSRVVAVARSLTKHGAAVLLIHHDTKAGGETPRGHSVLNGALDMALHVTRDGDGIVRGRLTKNRNGPCDRDIAFRIGIAEFGEDDEGDTITAAYCDPLDCFDERREAPSPKEYEVRTVLHQLVGSKPGVGASKSVWREAFRKSCDGGNPDTIRKNFLRAVTGLLRKGWIEEKDGIYFPSKASSDIAARIAELDDDII